MTNSGSQRTKAELLVAFSRAPDDGINIIIPGLSADELGNVVYVTSSDGEYLLTEIGQYITQ